MDNPNSPVTKVDLAEQLAALESRLDKKIEAVNERLDMRRAETQHQFDDLKEMFRDGQTELLKAFYGYTHTTDARLKENEVSTAAIRERLTAVEARVLELEKRLNMPPAA